MTFLVVSHRDPLKKVTSHDHIQPVQESLLQVRLDPGSQHGTRTPLWGEGGCDFVMSTPGQT